MSDNKMLSTSIASVNNTINVTLDNLETILNDPLDKLETTLNGTFGNLKTGIELLDIGNAGIVLGAYGLTYIIWSTIRSFIWKRLVFFNNLKVSS